MRYSGIDCQVGDIRLGGQIDGQLFTNSQNIALIIEVFGPFDGWSVEEIGSIILCGNEDDPTSLWASYQTVPKIFSEFYCIRSQAS